MTRAVAEKGVELVKGIHLGFLGDCVITVKQRNGIVCEVPYSDEDVATPVLVQAMILDKDIESPEIERAARRYCLSFIKEWNGIVVDSESDGITIGDLSCYVEAFEAGYKAARK